MFVEQTVLALSSTEIIKLFLIFGRERQSLKINRYKWVFAIFTYQMLFNFFLFQRPKKEGFL